MSLVQNYSTLLTRIAEKNDIWFVRSDSPFTISRKADEHRLPLSVSVYGNDTKVHLFFNIYDNDAFTALAKKYLQIQEKQNIEQQDDNSGLVISIDSDGFAAIYSATEVSPEEFVNQFESLINTADDLLRQVVSAANEAIKNAQEDSKQEQSSLDSKALAKPQTIGIEEVIKQYFNEEDYEFTHRENQFVFGFVTDKYVNRNDKQNLQIVIEYSDNDLLRFATPMMYQFDLTKTEYNLIASVIVWLQFRYKFLSMSLDPTDGELRISIDMPLGDGMVHTSQIGRIVSFILEFTESTYEDYFKTLLTDSVEAEKKLKELIEKYKIKFANIRWHESLEDKLDTITDSQKHAIDAILADGSEESGFSQDGI